MRKYENTKMQKCVIEKFIIDFSITHFLAYVS